ncbi:hypothetical protein MTCD1_03114 [Colwellia marinimaniae]|uniref:DUF4136 domain-containing protein n=1 Tax=Colwellia marinimaniae TaxID=1513592 RepID=A0ABQ0MYQ1_9GAMM|nr:hypothetical protein MTCD1_03114 [Colwellia marinimaniae]
MSPIKLIFICLLVVSVSGCSSIKNPVIYYNNFDFSQVKTYSFYRSGSAFFDSQNLPHAQRGSIELAIEKNLDAQDFHYSDLDSADIIVTYHLVKKQPKDYLNYNKAVLFCAPCLRANAWQKNNIDWHVYQGGLIIDLVDPKRKRSVWRSIYPLKFKVKDNSQELNKKVMAAVNNMLMHYPRK